MVVAAPVKAGATAYAEAVLAGEYVVGPWVRLACERHMRDLSEGAARGLYFDDEAAQRACDFFSFLTLGEGDAAGREFVLQPFQQFIVGSLFGWKLTVDGSRRFRTAYVEIGKGNGKTPLAAGIGLYMLMLDGEMGAEVYSAATTRDQAGICFRDAKGMAETSTALSTRLDVGVANIAHLPSRSFFRPVSSEHKGLDGKRPHCALVDELHEHPDALVVDKMRAGTKSRRQALIFEITNSGYDRESVCWKHHEYSLAVLQETIANESWFAYVCALDDGDDWTDEAVWPKANPGLGTILPYRYLREQVDEALGMPSKQNIVQRLNFCIWTQIATRWLSMDDWRACSEAVQVEPGARCYAGLDLASRIDITAFLLVFPRPDGFYDLIPFFWIPEETVHERVRRDRVPYDVWVRDGFLRTTSGNVTDYDVIREEIRELSQRYNIAEIGFDDWNATQLTTQLQNDGATLVKMPQTGQTLSAATKELEKLTLSHKLRHGGNPVLNWMAGNAVVITDTNGNLRPNRAKSTEKIDGIVATIMGLARAIVHGEKRSVYEDRGVLWL